MNKSDIGEALQDAFREGYVYGLYTTREAGDSTPALAKEHYNQSDTRVLVNEIWDDEITL